MEDHIIEEKIYMNTGICAYHQCKKETEVYKCEYCGEFFCKEHLKAKLPTPAFTEEWRKEGHPCPPHVAYIEAEEKIKKEEYHTILDKVLNTQSKSNIRGHYKPIYIPPSDKEEPYQPKISILDSDGRVIGRLLGYGSWVILLYLFLNYLVIIGVVPNQGLEKFLLTSPRNEIEIERIIFQLTNEKRVEVGASPLKYNSYITKVAREHSGDMIKNNYFRHNNVNLGENIGLVPISFIPLLIYTEGCGITLTNNQIASCHVKGWKNSPGHYRNMINPSYLEIGIGVKCNFFECKATQNFR